MPVGASPYFPNLTGLRGVAAGWVLCFHAWQFDGEPFLGFLTPIVKCGYFGVDLFFVLSGFLLSVPFHRADIEGRPRPSLKRFWNHRCRRVLPAYWVQMAVLVATYLYFDRVTELNLRDLVAQALLVQNIMPWPVPLLNPVYWSMPVEWDFYIALPLLALLLARCRWQLALPLTLLFAVVFRVVCYFSLTDTVLATFVTFADVDQLPGRVDQFFVGMCVAWIVVRKSMSPRLSLTYLFAGIAAILLLANFVTQREDFRAHADVPYLYFHHSLTAVSFGLLILGAAGTTRLGAALLANRVLTFFGFISYSLYLWGNPMLLAIHGGTWLEAVHAPTWVVLSFAVLPLILLVSWLSARYVEQPFLRAKKIAPHVASSEPA